MGNKVTMKDIAASLGLSLSTVSRALNHKYGIGEKNRQKILSEAVRLGFDFTAGTRQNDAAKRTVLAVSDRGTFEDEDFYLPIVHGMERALYESAYRVKVLAVDGENGDDRTLLARITETSAAGIILVGRASAALTGALCNTHIPLAVIDFYTPIQRTDCVMANNFDGAYDATRACLRMGHKRILFVGAVTYSVSFRERWNGYCCAMEEAGFSPTGITARQDGDTVPFDSRQLRAYLENAPCAPDCIFCAGDSVAKLVYDLLRERGLRIPEDVSVVGFDDKPFCTALNPPLASVRIPKEKMGEVAVSRLLCRIREREAGLTGEALTVAVETSLILRSSLQDRT